VEGVGKRVFAPPVATKARKTRDQPAARMAVPGEEETRPELQRE